MRIMDWSSDVCSSDLHPRLAAIAVIFVAHGARRGGRRLDLGQPRAALADMAVAALRQAGDEQVARLLRARCRGVAVGTGRFLVRVMVEPALAQEDRKSTRLNSSH